MRPFKVGAVGEMMMLFCGSKEFTSLDVCCGKRLSGSNDDAGEHVSPLRSRYERTREALEAGTMMEKSFRLKRCGILASWSELTI